MSNDTLHGLPDNWQGDSSSLTVQATEVVKTTEATEEARLFAAAAAGMVYPGLNSKL